MWRLSSIDSHVLERQRIRMPEPGVSVAAGQERVERGVCSGSQLNHPSQLDSRNDPAEAQVIGLI
jgi:hypothetical protein